MSLSPSHRLHAILAATVVACLSCAVPAAAQTIAPAYAGSYTLLDLGSAPDVPGPYGGLTIKAGDTNTLLLGGNANNAGGTIYNVGLVRGGPGNRISALSATPATVFSTAPNIDGGLAYGPNGVLFYTGYSNNVLGQIKPGSVVPDKIISLGPLGVATSVGALIFTPGGQFRVSSWSGGQYYNLPLTADGTGTFDAGTATQLLGGSNLPGGPEGLVYVPGGSPLFPSAAMLVAEYSAGNIAAYDVDGNGDPVLATRRDFITGLTGAEGATIDPVTGDFLFSTFGGGNRVISVRGFAAPSQVTGPEPATLALLGVGFLVTGVVRRRRTGKMPR